jgi:hypothetical protein
MVWTMERRVILTGAFDQACKCTGSFKMPDICFDRATVPGVSQSKFALVEATYTNRGSEDERDS